MNFLKEFFNFAKNFIKFGARGNWELGTFSSFTGGLPSNDAATLSHMLYKSLLNFENTQFRCT